MQPVYLFYARTAGGDNCTAQYIPCSSHSVSTLTGSELELPHCRVQCPAHFFVTMKSIGESMFPFLDTSVNLQASSGSINGLTSVFNLWTAANRDAHKTVNLLQTL